MMVARILMRAGADSEYDEEGEGNLSRMYDVVQFLRQQENYSLVTPDTILQETDIVRSRAVRALRRAADAPRARRTCVTRTCASCCRRTRKWSTWTEACGTRCARAAAPRALACGGVVG